MIESLIGFAAVLLLVLLRMPIAFAMAIVGMAGMTYETNFRAAISLVSRLIIDTSQDYGLSVVPLFILMGLFVNKGGISRELYQVSNAFLGHFRGGLAMATIAACGGFAAICGSSLATAATMSKVVMPEMRKLGYSDELSSASIAAGGTLGILIPPSIPMIVYGFVTEESVIALFLAGIGPGLVLVGLFIGYAMIYARFSPEYQSLPKASWSERRDASIRAVPSILLAMVVVGGLYTGAFTPTEAAAIGFACALIITIVFLRTLTWQGFKEAVYGSMVTTVAILLIVAGAKVFGKAIALYRIPQDISAFITANIDGPILFILAISVILLLMGLVFEALSMVLIMTPVLLPSALALGFDPIWFGVYMVVLVECALITPPVGLNLYVIQSVARTTLGEVSRGVVPFLALMLATVALLYIFPDIALYIPFKW